MSYKKPYIHISGQPLDADRIPWTMLSGTKSPKIELTVTSDTADKLMQLENPVSLHFECDVQDKITVKKSRLRSAISSFFFGGTEAEVTTRRVSIDFQNIYILERTPSNGPYFSNVVIGDQRFRWQDRLFSREYNKHRKTNKIDEIVKKRAGDLSNETNTARFSREGYAPYTLKKKGVYRFTNAATFNSKTGEKWTAMDIALNLIEEELGLKPGTGPGHYSFERRHFDNKRELESQAWEMGSLTSALGQMLAAARADIYQHPQGHIVIYEVDDARTTNAIFGDFQAMEGSGWPVAQDLKRIRPGKVRVLVPKVHELKFKYEETAALGNTVSRIDLPFSLDNVLEIPDTYEFTDSEGNQRKYIKGQYVRIEDALTAWNADPTRPFAGKATLSLEGIRTNYFADKLKYVYASQFNNRDIFNIIWVRRMAAIRSAYRRLFRISPKWMDRIRSWEPYRAALLDPITGSRAKSPVFVDYCEIPSFRLPLYKKGYKGKHKTAYNVSGYDSKTDDAYTAPFTVRPVNQELGVFEISYAQDPLSLIETVIPSKVVESTIPPLSANSRPEDITWHTAKLTPTHNMDVIISVVLAEPNDELRHYVEEYDMQEGDKNKVADIAVRMDTARYEWQDTTKAVFRNDRVIINNAKLANKDAIKALCNAEAKNFADNWQNQMVGVFSQPSWFPEWTPSGFMRSVTVQYTPRRGLETVFNMSERPQRIDIAGLLPASWRKIYYKQLDLE